MICKRNKIFINTFLFLLSVGLFSSCGKKIIANSLVYSNQVEKTYPLFLGQPEKFKLWAYSNISSYPNSTIEGKVGVTAGTREMIKLKNSEVKEGEQDILGSDSDTNPINL
jgi:hypothetical protein